MNQATLRREHVQASCCIVGGGPAGMMLGFLLARAGLDVVVLEKHRDFLRDFRGDTIHPSTLEVMSELGVLDDFLRRPHQEQPSLEMTIRGEPFSAVDFSHLRTRCKFIAFMPQWDFLNFVADQARRYPGFDLRMEANAQHLIVEGGRAVGVLARTPHGELDVRADLVVGADGRTSMVRDHARLAVEDVGVPIDVLWTRIPKGHDGGRASLGYFGAGTLLILIDRDDYFQAGYLIPKGAFDEIKQRGIEAFRSDIVGLAPFLRDQIEAVRSWDDVRLLTVKIDHLRRWYRPGVLCIGDSAHAMSPALGVGINLAIQDAVATANILTERLRDGTLRTRDLRMVQRRREWPTRLVQRIQAAMHRRGFARAQQGGAMGPPTAVVSLFRRLPVLSRVAGRVVGLGFRQEHVRTPDVLANGRPGAEERQTADSPERTRALSTSQ